MRYDGRTFKGPKLKCRECTERYLGCHDHCESYIQARKEWDDIREMARKNKREFYQIVGFEIDNALKRRKK